MVSLELIVFCVDVVFTSTQTCTYLTVNIKKSFFIIILTMKYTNTYSGGFYF